MAKQLQKLELTWIGKGKETKLEPRILVEDPSKSYGDIYSDNLLIQGDNLLALKALEQDYTGKIKCIFIDPPYNTGSAFEHYDDGIEHSLWLSLIKPRISLLKNLLSNEGSLWVSIDDNECHYLKVMMDEIFGRQNFVSSIAWEKDKGRRNDTHISSAHDHILLYAKDVSIWKKKRNLLPRTEDQIKRYKNPDNDPRGPWLQGDNGTAKSGSESLRYSITLPSGREVIPPLGNFWRFSKSTYQKAVEANQVYYGKDGNRLPIIKRYLTEVKDGVVPRTWWPAEETGTNQDAKRDHLRKLLPDIEPFSTPKPEQLLKRIIDISTNPGDIVLDSFLGSGTTASVAHKMNRKWIGVELGEQAVTHCLPRLEKVVKGLDKGGISEIMDWKGGGGFKFYTLAPSLIQEDKYGSEIINPSYNPNMLAAAMAKQEGFRYSPDENNYWKQGFSSEKDFIFTTTQFITIQMLDKLSEELQPGESLLVCCKSFAKGCVNRHSNITIKKIPQMLLGRCEFGKDDYSLNIVNLPHDDEEETIEENLEVEVEIKVSKSKKKKDDDDSQPSLF